MKKNLFSLLQISESVTAIQVTEAICYLLANVRDRSMLLKLTFSTLYNQCWEYIHIYFFISVGIKFDLMVLSDNKFLALWSHRRFYIPILFPVLILFSLFKTPEEGLFQSWNSAKTEYFKNKNFMLRKPDWIN